MREAERLALPEGARLSSRLGAGGNGNCPARGRECDPPVGSGYRRELPFQGRVKGKEGMARAGGSGARRGQGGRSFESVRLLGGGEVTRKFACALPSKAGLCPWPRVTGTACGKWCSRKYFPESWISCRKSASALRAVRKKRHPAQSFARSRPGIRPSGGFVAHLAIDHQMTPALFRPLFRATRSRGLHWRTGCRARLRRPSDLKHHTAPDCGEGMAVFGPDCALPLWSVGRRGLLAPLS